MTTLVEDWSAALDALEAMADAAGAGEPLPAGPVTDGLGPIPPALRDRAAYVARLVEAAASEVATRHAAAARELAAIASRRPAPATAAAPSFVDRFA